MCVYDVHFTEEEMTLMKLLNCKDGEAIRGLTQEYPGVHLTGEAYAAKDWASTNKRKLSLAAFRTWLAKSSRLKEPAVTSKSTSTHRKKVSPYLAKLQASIARSEAEYAAQSEAENNAHIG